MMLEPVAPCERPRLIFYTDHEYGKYEERLGLFWANRKSSSELLRQELKNEQDPKKFARLELDLLRGK